jgi:hypothetical protein
MHDRLIRQHRLAEQPPIENLPRIPVTAAPPRSL